MSETLPSAELPAAVLEYFVGEQANGRPYVLPEVATEGSRHDSFVALAATLRRRGLGYDVILGSLQSYNHSEQVESPKPDEELEDIARWAAGKAVAAPGPEDKASHDPAESWPRSRSSRLSQVRPRAVRWLEPGLIQSADLNLVAGEGGTGKSTYVMGVAARLSRGDLLEGQPTNVVLVSYEDTAAEVLRPRIEAAQGDLERVYTIEVPADRGGLLVLPRDLEELEWHVRELEARLLVIDPIVAAIDLTIDSYKDQDVRTLLARLAVLANETECAVVMIAHLNKAPSNSAYLRIANSTAFYNGSRSVVLVTEDAEDRDMQRLITQAKVNYARLAPIQRHRIEEIVLEQRDPVTGQSIVTTRLVYVEDAEGISRADVLGREDRSADRLDEAIEWLTDALSDGEWHDSAGLKTLAHASGVVERSLQRAAQRLGVEHERRGFPSSTWWLLPAAPSQSTRFGTTEGEEANPHG